MFFASVVLFLAINSTRADLIASYSFSGNANDSSGNGHDGTVYGATLTEDRFGNPDSAYSFDGDDYISVPDSSQFTLGLSDFTIEASVNIDSYSTDGGYYLMGHSNGPGDTNKWIFFLGNSSITLITTDSGWTHIGSYEFNLDQWYNVAIQRQGDELTAFVDGSSIGTVSFGYSIPNPSTSFFMGTAETGHPDRLFRGQLDDVSIYNHAVPVPIPGAFLLATVGLSVAGIKLRKCA
jgi:hypothetical protein